MDLFFYFFIITWTIMASLAALHTSSAAHYHQILPSFCCFVEKTNLQCSSIHRIVVESILMPYKQKDGKLRCAHKLEAKSTTGYRPNFHPSLLEDLVKNVHELIKNSFDFLDKSGDHAFYEIVFKVKVEGNKTDTNGESIPLTSEYVREYGGNFNGMSRINFLSLPSYDGSSLLDALDLAVDPTVIA